MSSMPTEILTRSWGMCDSSPGMEACERTAGISTWPARHAAASRHTTHLDHVSTAMRADSISPASPHKIYGRMRRASMTGRRRTDAQPQKRSRQRTR